MHVQLFPATHWHGTRKPVRLMAGTWAALPRIIATLWVVTLGADRVFVFVPWHNARIGFQGHTADMHRRLDGKIHGAPILVQPGRARHIAMWLCAGLSRHPLRYHRPRGAFNSHGLRRHRIYPSRGPMHCNVCIDAYMHRPARAPVGPSGQPFGMGCQHGQCCHVWKLFQGCETLSFYGRPGNVWNNFEAFGCNLVAILGLSNAVSNAELLKTILALWKTVFRPRKQATANVSGLTRKILQKHCFS